MKHDEFIGQVQHRAHLPSRGDAERATYATLQTLGERLTGNEVKDLASQLPPQFADYILSKHKETGERFNVNEFVQRVSDREGSDFPAATFHARAVIEVLQEAVTQGEIKDVLAQLPADYIRLFQSGSTGAM